MLTPTLSGFQILLTNINDIFDNEHEQRRANKVKPENTKILNN